uniref:Uncharacterized protein n=1 Tax=Neisseria meningitidis alpha522 TaxID=996307 RepID=I4E4J1_NEIME|nr:hypothetical protein NMALPHA522_0716 [Neisseria meningitidis alpha522]
MLIHYKFNPLYFLFQSQNMPPEHSGGRQNGTAR